MNKEYKYPTHRCLHPSPYFDKEYVVSVLTRAFHLIFSLSVGIGIGMVVCDVTKAIVVVIIAALGYLGTETDAWFYLPVSIFRLIRNDYPNQMPFTLHLPDDCLGEKADSEEDEDENGPNESGDEDALATDTDVFRKLLFGTGKDRQNAADYVIKKAITKSTKKSWEETPNITKMEEKDDGRIQSEDDGGSEDVV